nr:hypothetical protein [Tanacetum cinerariifolium]
TFDSIPQRLGEDYHSIKDDIPLLKSIRSMRRCLSGVDVLMIQPQPVESTQGANRTRRATRTPNPKDVVQKKRKGKQVAGEISSPIDEVSFYTLFKRTRPRLDTNYLEENHTEARDGVGSHTRWCQDYSRDGVKDFYTALEHS